MTPATPDPLLDYRESAAIFCGGILSPNRLDHPEGVCVDLRDQSLWAGGENGQLYHVSADGSDVRKVACSGGFSLGICMDRNSRIYVCDLFHACIYVYNDAGTQLDCLRGEEGAEKLEIPNFPLLSADQRYLYVSDTRRSGGPGIWRFDLSTGKHCLWMRESCLSANGMALAPTGDSIFLVESHLPGVCRIPILPDGSAGQKSLFLSLPDDEPDGLAFGSDGALYVSIYNPSRIYRVDPETGEKACLIEDPSTDCLHHATNLAFRGENELFVANLGGWHLTRVLLP